MKTDEIRKIKLEGMLLKEMTELINMGVEVHVAIRS